MKEKLLNECKSVFWTAVYFASWFGTLMLIKVLLLKEYQVDFIGLTLVIVGALVIAKEALMLKNRHIPFTWGKPAWIEMLTKTLLCMVSVFTMVTVEKSFKAPSEYGEV